MMMMMHIVCAIASQLLTSNAFEQSVENECTHISVPPIAPCSRIYKRTEADGRHSRLIRSDGHPLDDSDDELDHELPVVDAAEIGVANAARVVDDETQVQRTGCKWSINSTLYGLCAAYSGAVVMASVADLTTLVQFLLVPIYYYYCLKPLRKLPRCSCSASASAIGLDVAKKA